MLAANTFIDEQALAKLCEADVPSRIAELFIEPGAAIHSTTIREHYDLQNPALGENKLKDFAAAYQQK